MDIEPGVAQAAQLFKVLGHASRLGLVRLISEGPRTVGALAEATGLSQPLVSQYLRSLREVGVVSPERHGKEVVYRLDDVHVAHVVADAIAHAQEVTEPAASARQPLPANHPAAGPQAALHPDTGRQDDKEQS